MEIEEKLQLILSVAAPNECLFCFSHEKVTSTLIVYKKKDLITNEFIH